MVAASNDGPQMHESCQIFGLLDSHDQLMLPVTMSDGRGSTGLGLGTSCSIVEIDLRRHGRIDAGTPSP